MNVYWLEQTEADLTNSGTGVPSADGDAQDGPAKRSEPEWLGANERVQLGALRFAKRRADWQLGRWTAKHAIAACLQLPADLRNLAKIEVLPGPSGAPEVFLGDKRAPVTVSLSHRAGRAVCAVATCRAALGCDLEVAEPRSDAFVADYFATEEQAIVARAAPADRPWLATLIWSAKESALKALRAGLRFDTRWVIVTPVHALRSQYCPGEDSAQEEYAKNPDSAAWQPDAVNGWRPLRVLQTNGQPFVGWWQRTGNLLRTMIAAPPPARPRLLTIPCSSTSCSSMAGANQLQGA